MLYNREITLFDEPHDQWPTKKTRKKESNYHYYSYYEQIQLGDINMILTRYMPRPMPGTHYKPHTHSTKYLMTTNEEWNHNVIQ